MLDLDSFMALVDDLERKRTARPAAVASPGLAASRQMSGPGRKRKRKQADAGDSGLPAVGGRPWTGPAAPQADLLEDEKRRLPDPASDGRMAARLPWIDPDRVCLPAEGLARVLPLPPVPSLPSSSS
jgi:hypothetical protein